MALRYRWTGREYDSETGFYYLRARYYSPTLRRFVAEDPIGTAGGSNLYAYADGAPLEALDPSGTETALAMNGYIEQCYSGGRCLTASGELTPGRSDIIIDGVTVSGGGHFAAMNPNGFVLLNDGSTFTLNQRATVFEKNYTGKIAFDDPVSKKAFSDLRHQAYAANDAQLVELTSYAGRIPGLRIEGIAFTLSEMPSGAMQCQWGCKLDDITVWWPAGLQWAVTNSGIAAPILLAHELGHFVPLPAGIPNSRIYNTETYDGTYWENRARSAFGCRQRGSYSSAFVPC